MPRRNDSALPIDGRDAEYDDFAWFYDRYWSPTISLELLGAVERLLLPHLPAGARILDVCCGTGRIAAMLMERGFRVTGIDRSDEMLEIARDNAPAAELIAADARSFRLPARFDAAISLFDSLNHILTIEDLTAVFRNVHAALARGGRFVFDMDVEQGFERNWQGDSFTTVNADHASIVRGIYDPDTKLGQCEVTLFRLRDGDWQRSDVTIRERCYASEEIQQALTEVGFGEIALVDAAADLGMPDHVGRIFFLARR